MPVLQAGSPRFESLIGHYDYNKRLDASNSTEWCNGNTSGFEPEESQFESEFGRNDSVAEWQGRRLQNATSEFDSRQNL